MDGYVIEGHVPVTEIERLLDERPDVVGIAVAGMPIGSPGMERSKIKNTEKDTKRVITNIITFLVTYNNEPFFMPLVSSTLLGKNHCTDKVFVGKS